MLRLLRKIIIIMPRNLLVMVRTTTMWLLNHLLTPHGAGTSAPYADTLPTTLVCAADRAIALSSATRTTQKLDA
jgi:hypothetical protein